MLSPACTRRVPHCLHHGHAGPPGWRLGGGLRALLGPPCQRCHGQHPGIGGGIRRVLGMGEGGQHGGTLKGMLWSGCPCGVGSTVSHQGGDAVRWYHGVGNMGVILGGGMPWGGCYCRVCSMV